MSALRSAPTPSSLSKAPFAVTSSSAAGAVCACAHAINEIDAKNPIARPPIACDACVRPLFFMIQPLRTRRTNGRLGVTVALSDGVIYPLSRRADETG